MGLGDSWHKVAVYFGIADDEADYDEDETLAPHEELERSYQDRPNVRKLDGGRGLYRRPQAQCLLKASNDFQAILAWLRSKHGLTPEQKANL